MLLKYQIHSAASPPRVVRIKLAIGEFRQSTRCQSCRHDMTSEQFVPPKPHTREWALGARTLVNPHLLAENCSARRPRDQVALPASQDARNRLGPPGPTLASKGFFMLIFQISSPLVVKNVVKLHPLLGFSTTIGHYEVKFRTQTLGGVDGGAF